MFNMVRTETTLNKHFAGCLIVFAVVLLLVVVVLLVVLLLLLWLLSDLGPDIGDLLWQWDWSWEMSAFSVEAVLVSGVVDGDWSAVWSSVAVVSLSGLDLSVLDASVLHVSLFLSTDSIASLI